MRCLERFGVRHIDPRALIEDISLAERQTVEIVRAVSHAPRILFLDEPTSSLVEREVEWLFGQIRRLRAAGTCIVFTSHRWAEIRSIADRITIFRGGKDVGTFTDIDEDEAVRADDRAACRGALPAFAAVARQRRKPRWKSKTSPGRMSAMSRFSLHGGEILGIGGLAGHGHRELFRMLFGDAHVAAGQLIVDGNAPPLPRAARRDCAPASRWCRRTARPRACCCAMSVRDNATLSILKRLTPLRRAAPGAGARGGAAAWSTSCMCARSGHRPRGRRAQRRQPAEGPARPLAARRLPYPAALRRHARRRCRDQA